MEENPMSIYQKSSKVIRIVLLICIASFLLMSLTGFQDIKKEGVACTFQARIFDIEKPPPDQKVLVVKQIQSTQTKAKVKEQKIYVLVTSETIIGSGDNMKFEDLRLEMAIEIQGLKITEKEDGKENIVVLANRIRILVQ
ncbi:MAG: hypothetical protein MUO24_06980 [Desulfobacterales bacterium]|nr:hypothetical protein [Desulfobacterales bacterium]